MKKSNLIPIVVIILAALIGFGAFYLYNQGQGQYKLRINHNNEVVAVVPLNVDYRQTFHSESGENTVVIEAGMAFVSHADCPDLVCVHSPKIAEPGETIACLPHRLILEVIQE